MRQLAGLSYGHSLAYPHRFRNRTVPRDDLLAVVIAFVHPANLGPLPPSPRMLALKGEQIGLGKYEEFFKTIWY